MHDLIRINKCPVCGSQKRTLKFKVIRDGITSIIYTCNNCNLVYNGIRLKAKNESSALDKRFIQTDEKLRQEKEYSIAYMKQVKKLVGGKTLLEVGCGAGSRLEAAKKVGYEVIGIEPFKPSAKQAKQKGLNVFEVPLRKANLKKKFDVIIAAEVIEHFDRPIEEFKMMRSVLNDNGVIIIQTANEDSLHAKIQGKKRSYYYHDHIVYFSLKTLNQTLYRAGLKIVDAVSGILSYKDHKKRYSGFSPFLLFIHFMRALTFNKPVLSSMTVFIKKT